MNRNHVAILFLLSFLLSACGTSTPQVTPQLVSIYISSGAYPIVNKLYNCASNQAIIKLSDPQSADIVIRIGEPDHLNTPAYQIATEDIIVIVHSGTGISTFTMDQVRSIFLGQATNWKELGGNDLPIQVWSFSPTEDVQEIFNHTVMEGQAITSTARLAVSGENMATSISSIPGSIGVLPRQLLANNSQDVFTVAKAPVLAITKITPVGPVNEIIGCLQKVSH